MKLINKNDSVSQAKCVKQMAKYYMSGCMSKGKNSNKHCKAGLSIPPSEELSVAPD